LKEWYDAIEAAEDVAKLEEVRIAVFGKKGVLAGEFAKMKSIPNEEKGAFAKELNLHKAKLTEAFNLRKEKLQLEALEAAMKAEAIDVTLYSRRSGRGALHPVMETMDRIIEYFVAMNFSVKTGPMVEDDFHNFEALNLPKYHPARDM